MTTFILRSYRENLQHQRRNHVTPGANFDSHKILLGQTQTILKYLLLYLFINTQQLSVQ